MNRVILMGRLTKEPEIRYTPSNNTAVCQFTVAVDRRFKSEGQQQADFINCVAWRNTAEFVSKYFTKGSRIAIVGQIQTRTWDDNDGKRHYVTEVIADEVEFCESKRQSNDYAQTEAGYYDGTDQQPASTATQQRQQQQADSFDDGYFEVSDEGVPF